MCLTIIGTILSIATNIALGVWGVVMLALGSLLMKNPNMLFKQMQELKGMEELKRASHIQSVDSLGNLADPLELGDLIDAKVAFASQASILIIIGIGVIVISVFGFCCGQCGKLCRLVYVVGLGAVVAVVFLVLLVCTTPVGAGNVMTGVEAGLEKTFSTYLKDPEEVESDGSIKMGSSEVSKAWFKYQSLMQCCGVKGNLSDFNSTARPPASCCQLKEQNTIPTKRSEYSNYVECQTVPTIYKNLQGCSKSVVKALLLGPQYATIGLLIAMVLLMASLTSAVFLLGD